jgi:hypothetical protein
MVRKYGIKVTFAEPYRHNQLQQVDVAIRDLKRRWRHAKDECTPTAMVLWI